MEEIPRQAKKIKIFGKTIDPQAQPLSEYEYYSTLPYGCKFHPTDEELIGHYLKTKILNQALPRHMIRDVNINDYKPSQLMEMYPLNREKVWYFFSPGTTKIGKKEVQPAKARYIGTTKPDKKRERAPRDGCWKILSGKTSIFTDGQIVGFKRELSFVEGNVKDVAVQRVLTECKMDEYSVESAPGTSSAPNDSKFDNWVLCKIYLTTREKKSGQQDNKGTMVKGPNEERPNAVPKRKSNHGDVELANALSL